MLRTLPLGRAHIDSVVAIHMDAFPGFFLTTLGPRFLRIFYEAFLEEPSAVALVAEDGPAVFGAIVGTTNPRAFFRRLLIRKWWAFAAESLGYVVKHPGVCLRLVRAFNYRGMPGISIESGYALLSSIAVAKAAQGQGVGRVLVDAWFKRVQAAGALGAYLTTDANNNQIVNGFYQATGWRLTEVIITPEGRRMNMYSIRF